MKMIGTGFSPSESRSGSFSPFLRGKWVSGFRQELLFERAESKYCSAVENV